MAENTEASEQGKEHDSPSLHDWEFPEDPHTGVYTTRRVMSGEGPVTRVFHDSEDGAWQFHGPEESNLEDAVLVCFHHIVDKDASITELSDMPSGWCAWRDDVSSPWMREPHEEVEGAE